jgi:hypothetical protein
MNDAMSNIPASPTAIQVPLNTLPALMQRLAAFLSLPGPGAELASGLIRERLHAGCVQCGQRVSGAELVSLVAGNADTGPEDRRVARLRKGYCVKEGCTSLHYELHWEARAGEDGRKVEDFLLGKILADAPTVDAESRARRGNDRRRLLARLAIGIAFLLIVLLVKHRWEGGRIPVFEPKYKYQGAPR